MMNPTQAQLRSQQPTSNIRMTTQTTHAKLKGRRYYIMKTICLLVRVCLQFGPPLPPVKASRRLMRKRMERNEAARIERTCLNENLQLINWRGCQLKDCHFGYLLERLLAATPDELGVIARASCCSVCASPVRPGHWLALADSRPLGPPSSAFASLASRFRAASRATCWACAKWTPGELRRLRWRLPALPIMSLEGWLSSRF